MGLFNKKADPISLRSRALKQEIAALETQIRALSERAETPAPSPSTESHAAHSVTTARPSTRPDRSARKSAVSDFKLEADPLLTPELDMNLEKSGLFIRIVEAIRGKPTANPKLVTFLAAGSIQGLRPLRYEKRIARNRFILLSVIFLFLLWCVVGLFLRNN